MGTALITGASAGLGLEFAWQLATARHDLVLVSRDAERLERLAAQLRAAAGVRVEVLPADLSVRADVDRVAERLRATTRPVGLLVNNAGYGLHQKFVGGDLAAEEKAFDVMVRAVLVLSHAAADQMSTRGRGAILNVGSTAGYQPFPGQVGYAATKAFVNNYTQGLRGELAGTGVTVALLCPGPVRTEFVKSAGMNERDFADAFPKFLWKPSREVARAGVDALEHDRGTVIPGLPSQITTRLFQFMPRRVLLPLVKNQHPALRRDRSAR